MERNHDFYSFLGTLLHSSLRHTPLPIQSRKCILWGWVGCFWVNTISWRHIYQRSSQGTFIEATGGRTSGSAILSRIRKKPPAVIFYIIMVRSYCGYKLQQSEGFIISKHAVRGIKYCSIFEITWFNTGIT